MEPPPSDAVYLRQGFTKAAPAFPDSAGGSDSGQDVLLGLLMPRGAAGAPDILFPPLIRFINHLFSSSVVEHFRGQAWEKREAVPESPVDLSPSGSLGFPALGGPVAYLVDEIIQITRR